MGGELAYSSIHTFTSFVNSQHATIVMYVLGLTTQKSVCNTTADYVGLQNISKHAPLVGSKLEHFLGMCPLTARPPLGYIPAGPMPIIAFPPRSKHWIEPCKSLKISGFV